ncbi:hypothetical protein K1719_042121 [Acacia pycnantha]|nr:hypothetical protein K1719_042121 [Acacia pycnantha]
MWDWNLPLLDLPQPPAKKGKQKAKVHAKKQSASTITCQICGEGRLTLNLPPIWCWNCVVPIRRAVDYYTSGVEEIKLNFCVQCYKRPPKDRFELGKTRIAKPKLLKKKNDETIEESWVQCDLCEAQHHQICALLNGGINDGQQAGYNCARCYIQKHKTLPQDVRIVSPSSLIGVIVAVIIIRAASGEFEPPLDGPDC